MVDVFDRVLQITCYVRREYDDYLSDSYIGYINFIRFRWSTCCKTVYGIKEHAGGINQ